MNITESIRRQQIRLRIKSNLRMSPAVRSRVRRRMHLSQAEEEEDKEEVYADIGGKTEEEGG